MYCANCGTKNDDRSVFCINCGQQLKSNVVVGEERNSAERKPESLHMAATETKIRKRSAKLVPVISVLLLVGSLVSGGAVAFVCSRDRHADRSVAGRGRETESVENVAEQETSREPLQEASQETPQESEDADGQSESEPDSFTIMLYMIGSNLESDGGAATKDIVEIANAVYGGDVNVVIQTGGAKAWQNSIVPADKIGRFELRDGYLTMMEELPQTSMCRESTLTEFIKWGEASYPSDRYGLILWDHGGGVLGGYGVDENYPDDNLLISDIASAIGSADVHFDFIGFDACLMGSLECAYSIKDSADYMVASEESEAGIGWFYTDWLTYIGQNPDASMEEIGRKIVDGLVETNESDQYWGKDANETATLSLIDLDKIDSAYLAWKKFLGMSYEKMKAGGFDILSKARVNARCYGDNPGNGMYFEMVDMLDYVNECALPGTYDIVRDIRNCIVYTNSNISGSNGLSVYLPYYYPGLLDSLTIPMLESIGFDEDYFTYFDAFCAALASGNPSIDYEGALTEDISISEVTIPELIAFDYIDGQLGISFSEKQADTIVKIEMEAGSVNQNVKDFTLILTHGVGARFINLTEDGKLIPDNSHMEILAFFSDYGEKHYSSFVFYSGLYDYGIYEDGTEYKIQYSPAVLNGNEPIGILTYIYQDSYGEYYYWVQGYVREEENQYADREIYQFCEGDVISPKVHGYNCEEDPFTPFSIDVDESLIIGEDGLKCGYFRGDGSMDTYFKEHNYAYRYVITDIYRNRHYTEWEYY